MSGTMAELGDFRNRGLFQTCEQCGLCASACPLTGKDGYNVRRILRHLELDLVEEIAATPQPWQCTTCGRCETVCPNGIALLDLIRPLRALAPDQYVPEATPPCRRACPGDVDVPGYLRLIAAGRPREAYELILESVPFPGVLGRVCTHPCETACRRGEVNQAVSICALKRYAADRAGAPPEAALVVAPDTGRRAAVIGAGPAGLTAAFHLRRKGHQVTMFEAREKPGGMMRYGIPSYRLPEEVLDREIDLVLGLGIELCTGQVLGRDFDLARLKQEGFDAVFLALGLQQSRKIEIEGADRPDVLWGLDFLSQVSRNGRFPVKDRVVVIGGGNVAVDVGLTARKLGAKEVTLACLERPEEIPANPWEVEMAREEGLRFLTSWGPHRILGEGGRVAGIELIECLSVFDRDGRFAPVFGEAVRRVEADQVIMAIGQMADLSCLAGEDSCPIRFNLLAADPETGATGAPGVFAGGDVVSGPRTIIEAVAWGKRAAQAMDQYLGGDGRIGFVLQSGGPAPAYDGRREKGFADRVRVQTPTLPLPDRMSLTAEVELCFEDEQARAEAGRCLQCDLEWKLGRPGD
ncbi:MAG: FAD-dependent oxidoreductase [Thermodesulfobacteriota bacterium]